MGILAHGQTAGGMPSGSPGKLEIPEASLKSGLLESDLEVIDTYVGYWAEVLSKAGAEEQIIEARTQLGRGYNKYDSWQYRSAYAERVAKAVAPLLESLDVRKQVNAAMLISQMHEVTVQPVLESLVTSPNPALRLYGWTGYRRIRMLVLAQGRGPMNIMLNSVSRAVTHEDCGPVLSEVIQMLYLSSDRPSIVSAKVFTEARTRLWEILQTAWPRLCRMVRDGQPGMVRTAMEGLSTLRRVASDPRVERETQEAAVQMFVDLVWCAARGYAREGQTGSQTVSIEALLRECETAMNAVTKLRKIPINKALAVKGDEERAAAVELAVSTWIRFLENANWPVKEPEFETTAEATSQPVPQPS